MTNKPDAEKHEQSAKDFVAEVNNILIDGLGLSEGQHPDLFKRQRDLIQKFQYLLRDEWHRGWNCGSAEAEKAIFKAVKKAVREAAR